MHILVLGGTGFIGAHLVPSLLLPGYEVTVLNRGNSKNNKAVTFLQADRVDLLAMQHALKLYNGSEFDVIIDTSSLCLRHSQVMLAQLPQFVGHLIQISSASVYLECKMAKETDPIGGAPIWGDYGSHKNDVDRFLLDPLNDHPFCATIYRPPYLYGVGDSQDRASFIWSRSKAGLPVFVPPSDALGENIGDGALSDGALSNARRSGNLELAETPLIQFLHVADLVDAITESVASKVEPDVYNIAGEEEVSLTQWVSLVAKAAALPDPTKEVPAAFVKEPARSYFPFRSTALTLDASKLAGQGFSASIRLSEGLEKTFVDYCEELNVPALSETEKRMQGLE